MFSTVSATGSVRHAASTAVTANPATVTVPYGGVGDETVVTFTENAMNRRSQDLHAGDSPLTPTSLARRSASPGRRERVRHGEPDNRAVRQPTRQRRTLLRADRWSRFVDFDNSMTPVTVGDGARERTQCRVTPNILYRAMDR